MKQKYLLAIMLILYAYTSFAQNAPVVIEAESGTLGADYTTQEEEGVTYITSATDFADANFPANADKVATYEVTFPEAGTFDLFVRFRVGADGAEDDSFYYGNGFGEKTVDDAELWTRVNNVSSGGYTSDGDVVDGAGIAQTEVWKWINLSEFTGDETATVFTVEEGSLTQTIQFGGRENGLDLDKLAFGKAELYYTVANLENEEPGSVDPPEDGASREPVAAGQSKFIGNVYSASQAPQFREFWNQVTPENAGKWGSVEGTRDQYNWSQLDNAYALAKVNGMPFRFHVLIWGNQQPEWIETLAPAEQLEEIEEWMDTVAARYPDIDFVEVVNEPLHDPPNNDDAGGGNYIEALGGSGTTGWDWIIKSFELARTYFPNAALLINDYNIINSTSNINEYKEIIGLLQDQGLIDQVGIQCHAFSVNNMSSTNITNNLNSLGETGLPIYITELDIDGETDAIHVERYRRVFSALWESEHVEGITLWGYRPGMWRTDQMAYLFDNQGDARPAFLWMDAYVKGEFLEINTITVNASSAEIDISETLQMEATIAPSDATIQDLIWTVAPQSGSTGEATIDESGMFTPVSVGDVVVTATSIDGSEMTGTMVITISNENAPVTAIGDEVSAFKIYPNPVTNGNITIKSNSEISSVRVIDLRGRVIRSFNQIQANPLGSGLHSFTIELKNSPGVYGIQVFNEEGIHLRKIIVK